MSWLARVKPAPNAYLRDVLERLPTQKASQIHELLPHHWQHTA
ncbi:hypothetical protein LOKO_01279 [Halomonas chromatireducens]|uniref:Transposase IS66 C-terminal domain-containing protein n=1 Tax=Halomonas chromatireducens TaxID=507626 RepID=A0A0X8HCZ0_9GAMM|nr:transposase domain-containing protein [Halomonas chromatireducens]AMD00347.1 hypothetical protein LOKO_01279 [Halomonas chromatireducens]